MKRLAFALLIVLCAQAHAQNLVQTCADPGAAARAPFANAQCNSYSPVTPAAGEVVLTVGYPTYDWSQTNWAVEDTLPATAYIWATDAGWVLKSQVAFSAPAPPTVVTPSPPAALPTTFRYMPLGDSLTWGCCTSYINPAYAQLANEGYRGELALLLANAGYQATSVGSVTSFGNDQFRHEGHGGFTIEQLAAGINGWMAAAQPNVVLLMAGTNDALQGLGSTSPAALDNLIRTIYAASTAYSSGAWIIVSTLPPLADYVANAAVQQINAAIPGLVATEQASGINVSMVNMNSGLSTSDSFDGVHLYLDYYNSVEAPKWFAAITGH